MTQKKHLKHYKIELFNREKKIESMVKKHFHNRLDSFTTKFNIINTKIGKVSCFCNYNIKNITENTKKIRQSVESVFFNLYW